MRAWVVAALLVAAVGQPASCPADEGPVNCLACRGRTALTNRLNSLPRLDLTLAPASPNLGNYRLFTVCNQGDNDTCTLVDFSNATEREGGQGANQEDASLYLQGLLGWGIFGFVFAGLSLLCSTAWCTCRYCLFCSRYGGCGKKYPTAHLSCKRTCGFGFRPLGKSLSAGFGYGIGQWLARTWMMVSFVLVLVVAILGYDRGVTRLVPAIKETINATQTLMDVTQGITDPIAINLSNMASISLTRAGEIIKQNVDRYGDIPQVANNTNRIGYSMRNVLPHANLYLTRTLELNASLEDLRVAAQGSLANVQGLNDTSNFVVQPPLEVMREENFRLGELIEISEERVDESIPRLLTAEELRISLQDPETGPVAVADRLNLTIIQLPQISLVEPTAVGTTGGSLLRLENGELFGNLRREEREDLLFRLNQIRQELVLVIDLLETARRLEILNANVQFGLDDSTFADVDTTLAIAKDAADNVTIATNLEAIANLTAAIDQFDAVPAVSVLNDLQDSLRLHTDDKFDVILEEILNFWRAGNLITYGHVAAAESYIVNDTSVRVPECFHIIQATTDDLNFTWRPALADSQQFDDELTDFAVVVELELSNTTEYINAYQAAEDNARAVDFSHRESTLIVAGERRDAIQVNRTRTAAHSVQVELEHPDSRTTDDVVDMLRLMHENSQDFMFPLLSDAIVTLEDFSRSRCDEIGAVGELCDTDADCFGGFCRAGLPRCRFNFLRECDDDAICSATDQFDTCLFRKDVFFVARRALTWYYTIGRPGIDVERSIVQMPVLEDAIRDYPSLDESPLADLQAYVAAQAEIPIENSTAVLNQLEIDISPEAMLIERTFSSVADIQTASRLVDAPNSLPAVQDYNDSISMFYDNQDEMFFCEDWSEALRQYTQDDLPAHLELLTPEAMLQQRESQGLHAMLENINTFVDGLVFFARDNCDTSPTLDMGADTVAIRERLESLSATEFSNGGPVHFMLNFILSDERYRFASTLPIVGGNNLGAFIDKHWRAEMVQPWGPDPNGPKDADGNPNGPDRVCVTTQCLEASIDTWFNGTYGAGLRFDILTIVNFHRAMFNQRQVSGETSDSFFALVADSFDESRHNLEDPPPLAISRDNAYFLLYLIPIFVTGMGLCGALCFMQSCKRIQRWPAFCSVMCLFMLVPAVFWLAGGVYFPLSILYSDMCASYENVAWEFSDGSVDYLCNTMGGTFHGDGVCEFDVSDLATSTVSVNLAHAVRALLEDCSLYPDTLRNLYIDIAEAFQSVPTDNVANVLDNFGDLCYPDEEISSALRFSSRSLSTNTRALLDDLSDVYNCETLQPALLELRDGFCCNLGDALLYQSLSWYLIGFILSCCALPASILGIKRFPNQLWGPDYERNITFQPHIMEEFRAIHPPLELPEMPETPRYEPRLSAAYAAMKRENGPDDGSRSPLLGGMEAVEEDEAATSALSPSSSRVDLLAEAKREDLSGDEAESPLLEVITEEGFSPAQRTPRQRPGEGARTPSPGPTAVTPRLTRHGSSSSSAGVGTPLLSGARGDSSSDPGDVEEAKYSPPSAGLRLGSGSEGVPGEGDSEEGGLLRSSRPASGTRQAELTPSGASGEHVQ